MPLPTLTLEDSPEEILNQHIHSRTTLAADPLAEKLALLFDPLLADWKEVHGLRLQLVIDSAQTVARAFYIDTELNRLVAALESLVGKRNKKDPLWEVFLQDQEPAQFKKPILAGQLKAMMLWPAPLAESKQPELIEIGAALARVLPTAAEQAVAAAEQAIQTFDTLGRWRQHIDHSNAVRATAYGALLEIPHKNPEAKLAADYAELFFLHDTSRRGANKPRSSKEIAAELKGLSAKMEPLNAALKEATEREKAAEAAQVRREEKQKELALLKQQEKETKERKKELEKALAKKK